MQGRLKKADRVSIRAFRRWEELHQAHKKPLAVVRLVQRVESFLIGVSLALVKRGEEIPLK